MKFDLIDMKLFCDVVDAGSITAGAQRAALALAAASTRIRGMEQAIGVELLVRSRTGVKPTAAGLTLVKHARTMLEQAARLREDLDAYTKGVSGEVRILANTNASTEFLPEAMSGFLAKHPNVRIDLEERLSDEIVGLIAEGVADIGIVAGTVDVGPLETYPFRSDRFVVVTPKGHPLADQARVDFAQVLGFDFVGLDRSSALQRFLAGKAARLGRGLILRVQLRSFDAVCRLVEAGVGIGIVPHTTAARVAATVGLSVVELNDDWAVRELTICVRNLEALRPFARDLVESLRAG
ncbi:LysR substrate-binding domain-containing protein [Phenylobacterium aquaticum]|uniref:LysR substrate-binding domain-containing protein n=1 Tax=Phenylobacterium aquaticum TaxID=1763816 RepID=UPI0026ECE498|nr:LysR substrate-binding domain-containing protein [Phenylobacterium aquaticum]